jgi:hypothetical protein
MNQADIDIDVPDRQKILDLIKHTSAQQTVDGKTRRHNSGVYVTAIPDDPVNQWAAIDYQDAEQRGYFKLDFLNMSVYQLIQDQDHYEKLLSKEPNWQRLWTDSDWAAKLIHVGSYVELLQTMKPDSIQRMAAFISIIRPGKSHLQNKSWDLVFSEVWNGDHSRGYTFKQSHSLGYALLVTLHMNLLDD